MYTHRKGLRFHLEDEVLNTPSEVRFIRETITYIWMISTEKKVE